MADDIKKVKIQVRRGVESELTDLSTGEPALSVDSQKVFIGTGNGNKMQIAKQDQVNTIQTDVTNTKQTVTGLSTDNTQNKQDISQLKTSSTGLRSDVNTLINEVSDVSTQAQTNTNDITTLKGTKSEVEAARGGKTSLKDRFDNLEKAQNEQTFECAANQDTFVITNGSYTPGTKTINVYIEGSLISRELYIEVDSKTIKLLTPRNEGDIVTLMWLEGKLPVAFGHNSSHYKGGQDEVDVTKLANFKEQVTDKIGILQQDVTGRCISILYPPPPLVSAKGDNTDETTVIQAILDYAGQNGIPFYVPKGTFRANLTIKYGGTTILGGGRNSILKSALGSTNPILSTPYNGTKIDRITVSNLYLQGNWTEDSAIMTQDGLHLLSGNAFVSNVECRQICGTAFFLDGAGQMINCAVNYTNKYGYHIGTDCGVSNCSVGCSNSHGFYLAAGNTRLNNCFAWMSGTSRLDGNGQWVINENVNGFYFSGAQGLIGNNLHSMASTGEGFYLQNSSRNNLNFVASKNGKGSKFKKAAGISLYRSSFNTITGTIVNDDTGNAVVGEWGWHGKGIHIQEANTEYVAGNKINITVAKDIYEPISSDGSTNNIMGYNDIAATWQNSVDGTIADNYPSKGVWAISQQVRKRNIASGGNIGWYCVYSYNSTTTIAATSGSTSVTIGSTSPLAVDDNVGILLDNGDWHFTKVSGLPGGNVINLATAIPVGANVSIGNRVHTNRWKSFGTVS